MTQKDGREKWGAVSAETAAMFKFLICNYLQISSGYVYVCVCVYIYIYVYIQSMFCFLYVSNCTQGEYTANISLALVSPRPCFSPGFQPWQATMYQCPSRAGMAAHAHVRREKRWADIKHKLELEEPCLCRWLKDLRRSL